MKRIHIFGLVLCAMAVFATVAATAAFAEDEWLANGAAITTELSVDSEGTIILENVLFGINTTVDCSGLFEGTVGPGGKDLVTDAVNLLNELFLELSAGTGLSCEVLGGGCTSGSLAVVNVDNLSLTLGLTWETKIELDEGTIFLDDFPANSGYEVKCTGSLGEIETLCEGLATADLTNETGGVLGIFLGEETITCTVGSGKIKGEGLTALLEGTLSVS